MEACRNVREAVTSYRPIVTEIEGVTGLIASAAGATIALFSESDPEWGHNSVLLMEHSVRGIVPSLLKLAVPIMLYLSYTVYSAVDR